MFNNSNNNITFLIKERVSLSQIISKRINLVKKGNRYLALCPFHKENTPSFYVDDNKGFFHCFGCGKSGDVFEFLTSYEKYSFKDALEYLSEIAGISLYDYSKKLIKNPNFTHTTNFSKLLNDVANWFHNQLFLKENELALKYFLNRGLSRYTIKAFNLGYAPKKVDSLTNYLLTNGYKEEDIINSGLKYNKDKSSHAVFTNRVIFPIKNKSGKIIAFGGRSLNNDIPKYINSKDSSIFHKKLNLYGLNESLNLLKENKFIILVEGYLDVIMLQQEGFAAVAPLGTAISLEQITLLVKLKLPLFICLDSDTAGINASLKVANILLEIMEETTLPKFIQLPENEDPDSYLRKYSKEDFRILIQNAIHLSEFLWNNTVKESKLDTPEVKALLHKNFQDYCNKIKNSYLKEEFSKYFFNRLNSMFPNYSKYNKNASFKNLRYNKNYTSVKNNFNKKIANYKYSITNNTAVLDKITNNNLLVREYFLLAYIVSCPEIYSQVEQEFSRLVFSTKSLENFKQNLVYLLENDILNVTKLKAELAKKGFSTILNDMMNMVIIKKSLARLKEPKDFMYAFYDTYNRLLYNALNDDVNSIKKIVLPKDDNLGPSSTKYADKVKILHHEMQKLSFPKESYNEKK